MGGGARPAIHDLAANRLDKDAAAFVDAIHTDGSFRPTGSPSSFFGQHFGTLWQTGHLDFYPDGGVFQNGCGIVGSCSHSRAVLYYLHSINNEHLFRFTPCRFQRNLKLIYRCLENDPNSRIFYNIGEDAYYQYCDYNIEQCNGKPRRTVADRVAYRCWSFTE